AAAVSDEASKESRRLRVGHTMVGSVNPLTGLSSNPPGARVSGAPPSFSMENEPVSIPTSGLPPSVVGILVLGAMLFVAMAGYVSVRAAIRRLFGIALTLIAVSVGMFWASASYARHAVAERNQQASPFAAFPVFFNPRPVGVRDISTDAVRAIAHGGKEAIPARLALARLGGAALPYVLP